MRTEARVNHSASTVLSLLPSSRPSPVKGEGSYDRASAQDKAFLSSLRGSITTFFSLFIFIVVTAGPSFGATAKSPEEIWKELEKLSPTEREEAYRRRQEGRRDDLVYKFRPRERHPLHSSLQEELPVHQRTGLAI